MKRKLVTCLCFFFAINAFGQTFHEKTYRSLNEAIKDSLNVKKLTLSGDSLKQFSAEILKLENLQEIALESSNEFDINYAITILAKCSNLKKLWISDINSPNIKGLGKLKNLEELDLDNVGISILPFDIANLKKLREINLEGNPQLDFNQAFNVLSKIKTLKVLWLGKNKLSTLPVSISKLKFLEDLWLDDNEFSKIPPAIKKLKIKYLSFFSNKLQNLDLKKGDLIELNNINLCYNNFKVFPAVELSLLPNLNTVRMWYANVEFIPRQIARLKKLKLLNLESNNISKLPSQINKLKNLAVLELSGNSLSVEGIKPLFKMTWLLKLDLTGNKVVYLPSKIKNLINVTELFISNNPLTKLPAELLSLKKLEWLGIGMLPNLPWDETFSMLAQIKSLNKLSLYYNHFNTIPIGLFKLKQVHFFIINGNGFRDSEEEEITKRFPNARLAF